MTTKPRIQWLRRSRERILALERRTSDPNTPAAKE